MPFKRRKSVEIPEVYNDLAHLLHEKIIDGTITPAEMAVARNLIKDTGFFKSLEADDQEPEDQEAAAAQLEAIRRKVVSIRSAGL
jgi:hypothetical protein